MMNYQNCILRTCTYSSLSDINPLNTPLGMAVISLPFRFLTKKQFHFCKQLVHICLQLLNTCCTLKIPLGLVLLQLMLRYLQAPLRPG